MRCPYCGTENDEGAQSCRNCAEELTDARSQWKGAETESVESSPEEVAAASDQWDPAKRFSGQRPASAFVPPARYPTHFTWILTIILTGIPATAIHAVLFFRGIQYENNLEIGVAVILACCLPLSLLALLLSWVLLAVHRAGRETSAYRLSRVIALFCWASSAATFALYVLLFMRLMSSVGEFWVY